VDLNDLELFVAVVETESFSTAARRLGVPKSSVSRGIARLESAMRNSLLHRTTRRVSVSAAGQALYEKVRAEITSIRTSVGELPTAEVEPSGPLRVTAVSDMSELLAEHVARFSSRHRGVDVHLRLSNDYVDLVKEGIDVALRFASKRLKDSTMQARRLGSSSVAIYASPSYLLRVGTPRAPADLDKHEWVVHSRVPQLVIESEGRKVQVVTRGRMSADNMAFIREAAVAGAGIAYLGPPMVEKQVAAGTLVRVLPAWSCHISDLWAVWPGSARKTPRTVTAFVDFMADALKTRAFG
jgi:DNA-binding transcriptional LysR family regulator